MNEELTPYEEGYNNSYEQLYRDQVGKTVAQQQAVIERANEAEVYKREYLKADLEKRYLVSQQMEKDFDELSKAAAEARKEGSFDLEAEALKRLTDLAADKREHAQNLRADFESYQANYDNNSAGNPPVDNGYEEAKEIFKNVSMPVELDSPDYAIFLDKRPEFNPFSPQFDADAMVEFQALRQNYNRFLRHHKKLDHVGTKQYYDDLDLLQYEAEQGKFGVSGSDDTDDMGPVSRDSHNYYAQNTYPQNTYLDDTDKKMLMGLEKAFREYAPNESRSNIINAYTGVSGNGR